jgi:galactokinase
MIAHLEIQEKLTQDFHTRFGETPGFIVRAPGRVNLIGEHTDYNDGFVLPMAIDRSIWIAARPREDLQVDCYSMDFDEGLTFSLDDFQRESHGWGEYLKGVAWVLQEEGYSLKGWDGVVVGDIPIGAGLSSSAAIEMATLRTFSVVSDFTWDAVRMAKLGQSTEVRWVGVNSGIMDQMVSALGEEGHALLIDCRSLDVDSIPMPDGIVVLVFDTCVRRNLVDSAYNERQAQCQEAARFCGVSSLRDLTSDVLETFTQSMKPILYRRARHVVSENERTLQAVEALRLGDVPLFGELMNASHWSLKEDYEVSSGELDMLVEMAQSEGTLGARMTGAGFGGCIVSLVDESSVERISRRVMERYREKTGLQSKAYPCVAAEGVELIKLG